MSGGDDWAPGDLALCVSSSRMGLTRAGCIYTVTKVIRGVRYIDDTIGTSLVFAGVRHPTNKSGGSWAGRFRKIRPHTPDEQDEETTRLLTGAPVKEPVA